MRLTILGGGGFRVPLVYGALLRDAGRPRVEEVVLHDLSPERLTAVGHVCAQLAAGHDDAPRVRLTTDLDEALRDAAFVFSAIRVGGLEGRTADERVALDLGLLGQETTGPGGVAFGLRTIPVALRVAERVAAVAPRAWVINFTNPAGMITEAMQRVLGDRVIGICDSPLGLVRRAARALGVEPGRVAADYAGLNHLGWLRGLTYEGRDVLPDLLADDAALTGVEEARLFGADWVRSIGALPNEYLYYYYFTREAVAAIGGAPRTRGEALLEQQSRFYAAVAREPGHALAEWRRARRERDASYMAETRDAAQAGERDAADLQAGGYEGIALALMSAIARGGTTTMILNVRNGSAVAGLPQEAVVEVPCVVDPGGVRPLAARPLHGQFLGLIQQVKAVEQLAIEAAVTGSARVALRAFAAHPLVDSVPVARALLDGYRTRIPELASVLHPAG
ncbi:6-phospho-beta-glucosidase [Sphaerisporangium siamense]|uniref:6-phospho-beta-glucosidase n=1 Tax=Sphaerisporangium siamense TaxID=795645 RepID=A0A7W7GBT0_9ACTN|nr:6-phospho-beta-glucosidase [Sphaerisporangium siamense]MBB4702759.1 6-phospho-beta-glucosidase [Sphaerisporangium siamense]GII83486.1 6-phospho-beta-glucosidase [Sphaerisporangium siamense]